MKLYSLATSPSELALRTNVADALGYVSVYQARPGMKMPLVIYRNDRPELVSAMWGMRSSTAYNSVHMDRVLKSRPWNVLIRRNKCAVPANCIVVEKNNEAFLIRLPQHRLFMMAGVYQQKGSDYFFTLLETEAADIISPLTADMPVFFHCDHVLKWLRTEELGSIFRIADKAGNNWFDYFRVDAKILDARTNSRELLIPLGASYEQYVQRQKKITAINFEKDRMNRRNFK